MEPSANFRRCSAEQKGKHAALDRQVFVRRDRCGMCFNSHNYLRRTHRHTILECVFEGLISAQCLSHLWGYLGGKPFRCPVAFSPRDDPNAGSVASSKAAFDEDPDLPGAQGAQGKSLKIPSGN